LKQIVRTQNSPIDRLVIFSLRHSAAIIAFVVAVIAAGFVAASRLPLEATRAQPAQRTQLVIGYAGRSAEEVEKTIAIPVEQALQDLPQVKISSVSRPDWAVITLSYPSAGDDALIREQIRARLDKLTLPREVNTAMVRVPPDQ
jgi:multidrug efflux pump subunit AcrB